MLYCVQCHGRSTRVQLVHVVFFASYKSQLSYVLVIVHAKPITKKRLLMFVCVLQSVLFGSLYM